MWNILITKIVFRDGGEKNVWYEKTGCSNAACVMFKCEVLPIAIIRMGKVTQENTAQGGGISEQVGKHVSQAGQDEVTVWVPLDIL